MKDKLMHDFQDYLQKTNIKSIHFSPNNTELNIISPLFNDRISLDVALIALIGYGTYTVEDKGFYLIPILFVYLVLIIVIWIDFNYINNIRIDFTKKEMVITSRNIFKRAILKYLLRKEDKYNFQDCACFYVRSNESSKADMKKYFIDAKFKQSSTKTLFFLKKEDQAISMAEFLNNLLKN